MATKTITRVVNVGGAALARDTGYTQGAISQMLQKGMSRSAIIARARANGRMAPATAPVTPDDSDTDPYLKPRTYTSPRSKRVLGITAAAVIANTPVTEIDEDDNDSTANYNATVKRHGEKETFDQAKTRKMIAQAEAQELSNKQRLGQLVPTSQVEVAISRIAVRIRDRMMQLPGEIQDRLAIESHPARCGAILKEELYRILTLVVEMEELWEGEDEAAALEGSEAA